MCELQELFDQLEAGIRSGKISPQTVRSEVGDRIARLMQDYPELFMSDEEKLIQEELGGLTWQEYFHQNPPPKYEGVKKSGKALDFFLKYYRGKKLDENNNLVKCEDEDACNIDFVELGMRQADLRKYDKFFVPRLASSIHYLQNRHNFPLSLQDFLPPTFKSRDGKI